MYLAYLDDSGDETCDLLAGLIVPLESWTVGLGVWLNWRRFLFRRWGIPTDFELHAQEFVRHPSKHPVPSKHSREHKVMESGINTQAGQRHEVYRRSLETVRYMPGTRVFGVHRPDVDRIASYEMILTSIQTTMEADEGDASCLVMVDGFDTRLRAIHRTLDLNTRLVIEDSWHEDSAESQFIQIADLVVHAAFQHIKRQESRRFMWDWYPQQFESLCVRFNDACACGISGH